MKAFWLSSVCLCITAALMALSGPVGSSAAFPLLYAVSFAAMIGMVVWFPQSWRDRRGMAVVVFFGLGLRLLFLWFPPASDVHRYVWEGFVQLQGANPYSSAPSDPSLSVWANGPLRSLWEGINHKDMAAGYPPLALLVFRFLAWVRPDPVFFKGVMAAADAAALLPLGAVLIRCSLPPQNLLLAAANPLLLVFLAGEGHLDAAMVLLLSTGVALVLHKHDGAGFFFIGCAAMVKYFAWAAVPFLLTGRNWKKAPLALLPVLLYLPYADAGAGLFESLVRFGTAMHYNDSITALARWAFGEAAALWLGGMVLAVVWSAVFLLEPDRMRSLLYALGGLLLCLPTLHPWYLALVAPFAAAAASPAWILLQAGVVMTVPVMAVERATGVFQEIHWLKFFEYGFFFGWLAVAAVRPRGRPGPVFSGVRDLAVVIPALNESWHIERCLESLRASGGIARVVVSDGGSSDETRAVARRNGAAVVRCPPGRGRQIRCGVRQTTEDAVMVVHADCRLEPDTVESVLRALNTDRRTAGGAVGMRFFPADRRKRLLSALNNLRSRLTGISFGDQCQFFRRAALDRAGGFPDLMLMEDVELSLRLRGQGRLAFLPHGVRVSGRRWDRIGFASGVWKVLYLFAAYLTCRRLDTVDPHADFFYRRYYDRGVGIE